jgi:PKD repeat protein
MKTSSLSKLTIFTFINFIILSAFSQYNNAFRIKITGNNYSDETIIRLVNGASQNFDSNYDAWKLFSPNPNVPSIYTQMGNGQELSINSLPELSEDKSIDIYTNIPISGTYTITIEEIYALSSNYKISLTDNTSSSHYRIWGDTSLTFTLNSQQNVSSFSFNISTPLISTTTNESCFEMGDGAIALTNPGNTDWNTEIYDNNNNLVQSGNSNFNQFNINNIIPGNYIAKVSSKGIVDQFNFSINAAPILIADFNLDKDTIYISDGGEISLTDNSQNAQNYTWDFDDGGYSNNQNPIYSYSNVGEYNITLTASNSNCLSVTNQQLTVLQSPNITTSINNLVAENFQLINQGNGNYEIVADNSFNNTISIYDINGKIILKDISNSNNYRFSINDKANGIYIVNAISENGELFQQKIIN